MTRTPEGKCLKIDYLEIPAPDLAASKRFYAAVFGWEFKDWGPAYASFDDGRMRGGLSGDGRPTVDGALLVAYAPDLKPVKERIVAAGGKILRDVYEFPGGRRFHFADPAGNQLAVWSE